jgi:hypothetical protein
MQDDEFEWDDIKAADNKREHGISFDWALHLTGVEHRLGQWNVPMPAPISAPKGCSSQAAETTRTSAQLGATFAEPPVEANP